MRHLQNFKRKTKQNTKLALADESFLNCEMEMGQLRKVGLLSTVTKGKMEMHQCLSVLYIACQTNLSRPH